MTGYICTKAVTLGATKYTPGQNIPADAVLPSRVRALTKQGFIAPQAEATALPPVGAQERPDAPAPIVIPLTRDGAVYEVVTPYETLLAVTSNLQLNADEVVTAIKTMTDDTALILLHALDARKTVKDAAEARAAKLEKEREEAEQQGGNQGGT